MFQLCSSMEYRGMLSEAPEDMDSFKAMKPKEQLKLRFDHEAK